MVNGNLIIDQAPGYEDLASLKKYIKSQKQTWKNTNEIRFLFNQVGTGSEVEIEEKGGLTITDLSADADLYAWAENNHADGLSLAVSGTYVSSAGALGTFSGNLNAADSQTATAVVSSTDFFRRRTLSAVTTTNTGYVAFGNQAKNAWYGVVEQGNVESYHSRYRCPASRDAWIGQIGISHSIGTNIDTYIKITYTPYGETTEHILPISVPNNNAVVLDPVIRIATNTDVKFELKGNLSDNAFDIHIIEAIQR